MPSKSVENFLNSPISSFRFSKNKMTTIFKMVLRKNGIRDLFIDPNRRAYARICSTCANEDNSQNHNGCSKCYCGALKIMKKELDFFKKNFALTTIKDYLELDYEVFASTHYYQSWRTDIVGETLLQKGFGYLCWWRIDKKDRTTIFKSAVKNMGKEFVLSLPLQALPIGRPVINFIRYDYGGVIGSLSMLS